MIETKLTIEITATTALGVDNEEKHHVDKFIAEIWVMNIIKIFRLM